MLIKYFDVRVTVITHIDPFYTIWTATFMYWIDWLFPSLLHIMNTIAAIIYYPMHVPCILPTTSKNKKILSFAISNSCIYISLC